MEMFGDEKTFMSVTAGDFCETGATEESYAGDEAESEKYVDCVDEAAGANAATDFGATSGAGASKNGSESLLFGGDTNSGAMDCESRDLVEGAGELFGDDKTFCSIVISNAGFCDGAECIFDDYINKDNLIAEEVVGADETVVGYGAGVCGSCAGTRERVFENGATRGGYAGAEGREAAGCVVNLVNREAERGWRDDVRAGGTGAECCGSGCYGRGNCVGATKLRTERGLFGSECSEIDAIFEELNRKFAGVRAADCGRIKVGNNYGAFEIERRCGEPYARFCPCPPPKPHHGSPSECDWERLFGCSESAWRDCPPKCNPDCVPNCDCSPECAPRYGCKHNFAPNWGGNGECLPNRGNCDCTANCEGSERSSKCGRCGNCAPQCDCGHISAPNWNGGGDCEVNCGSRTDCAQNWGKQPDCPPSWGCRPVPHCPPSCKQLSREIYFRLLRVAQMVGHLGNCAPNECAFEAVCSVKQNLNMLAVAMLAVTKRVCDEKPVCASGFAVPKCGFLQGVDACVCELGDVLRDIALLQSLPCARGVYGALVAVAFGVSRCQAELAALLPRRCW